MKFDKAANSAPTQVNAETMVRADRYAARRARIEEERNRPINHEMRRRVSSLFTQLIAELDAKRERAPRWRGEKQPARALTPEEMAELWSKNPVKLSDEARMR